MFEAIAEFAQTPPFFEHRKVPEETQTAGSPFFAYFLWRSKESESPAGARPGQQRKQKTTTSIANYQAKTGAMRSFDQQKSLKRHLSKTPQLAAVQLLDTLSPKQLRRANPDAQMLIAPFPAPATPKLAFRRTKTPSSTISVHRTNQDCVIWLL